jgi:hypothetical protein
MIELKGEKDRFTAIAEKKTWKRPWNNSLSGVGSELPTTENIRREIPIIIKKYSIKSILDCPCGDFFWMSNIIDSLELDKYVGGDIVDFIIEDLKNKYDSKDKIEFKTIDLISDELPTTDLIICRDCLVHMNLERINSSIKNMVKNSKYILMTHFPDIKQNVMSNKPWFPYNLTIEPFNLKSPIEIIQENEFDPNSYGRKTLSLWKAEDLI